MPKSNNKIGSQIVDGLIHVTPSTWKKKVLKKDESGKETVETVQVTNNALRYPLAQNVSDENVERAAKRWMR